MPRFYERGKQQLSEEQPEEAIPEELRLPGSPRPFRLQLLLLAAVRVRHLAVRKVRRRGSVVHIGSNARALLLSVPLLLADHAAPHAGEGEKPGVRRCERGGVATNRGSRASCSPALGSSPRRAGSRS